VRSSKKVIKTHFDEEISLARILSPLALLEQIDSLKDFVIVELLRAVELADVVDGKCAHALLCSIGRLLADGAASEAIFANIWHLVETEKIALISSLVTLFKNCFGFYGAKSSVILASIRRSLISTSTPERKQCHNFIFQLLEHRSSILLDEMSEEQWRAFLKTCLIWEENQQHIIKAHMAEFVATFTSCPPSWGLLLYARGFRHENKKVVRLLCFSALQNIRCMSPAESAFLSDALIPLTANMFLYDILDDQCRRRPQSPKMARLLRQFCARNPAVLARLFDGLSRRAQSAPPLFYWLTALEQEWAVIGDAAMTHRLIHEAARELLTKCIKTHPIQIRSAAQSLICAILIKSSTNPDELFFQTLARLTLFSDARCKTRNVFNQLRAFVGAAAQPQDGALSAADISTRLSDFDIRARLFKMALSDEPFPTALLGCIRLIRQPSHDEHKALTAQGVVKLSNIVKLCAL